MPRLPLKTGDGLPGTESWFVPKRVAPKQCPSKLERPVSGEDAIAVATIYNIITRYADTLAFAIPTKVEFDRAGDMLLKRGYA